MDVVIVGGGQGGLAVSYLLKQAEVEHLVLEKGEIGESWRSQRWDSFYLNTPNWSNNLPGLDFYPETEDAFSNRNQLLSYFERYKYDFNLPVRQHTAVHALEKLPSGLYSVQTESETFNARAVVLATGCMSRPKIPQIAQNLSGNIANLSAGSYKNADELPDGAIVIVGSGQSGCQIAEDLLGSERRVYLCASRVSRVPRVYRGKDIVAWLRDMGLLEVCVDDLEDSSMVFTTQPQVSGTNGGHTVSLQSLACNGATLLGKVLDVNQGIMKLDKNLMEYISFADDQSQTIKNAIDDFINRRGISAPVSEPDPGEPALPDLKGSDQRDTLDLKSKGVGSIIWCTGFDADWSWVKTNVFDENGQPRHRFGISDSRGLYFIGFPWLSKRKSGILYGISEDAARIVHHIEENVLTSRLN